MSHLPKTVLLPIITQLATDYRCYKVAKTLKKYGYAPHILCDMPDLELGPMWDGFKITPLTKRSHLVGFLKAFILFNLNSIPHFWNKKNHAIIVEDYPALFTAALIGWLRKIPVIFDSHELTLETPGVNSGYLRKKFWQLWHNLGIKLLNRVVVVSPLYQQQLQKHFPAKSFFMLPNVPFRHSQSKSPADTHRQTYEPRTIHDSNKIQLIFIGHIRPDANLFNVIQAIRLLPKFHLTIIGDGPLLASIKNATDQWGMQNRIRFTGTLPHDAIRPYLKKAHIGIDALNPNNKSVDYTWANKSFEYIQTGIPVLLGNTAGYRSLVASHNIGVLADPASPESIRNGLHTITKSYSKFTAICKEASKTLCWDAFEENFIRFFEGA